MDKTKAVEKALPESMYFLLDDDRELDGPFNEQELNEAIEDHGAYYDDMVAFMVSCDGEKLVYHEIAIEEKASFTLTVK